MEPDSLIPYGPHAWLVRSEDHEWLQLLANHCDEQPPLHLSEWVMGYDSLLLVFEQPMSHDLVQSYCSGREMLPQNSFYKGTLHQIPVHYDGPDLAEVSQQSHLTGEEVIKLHSAPIYTVRFLGFSPGFAYLDGLDPKLILPRKAQPRSRMAAGALAIGGPHTGIYTTPSPGGWHWLGNTTCPLFDPSTEFLALHPGDTIQFLPQDV